VPDDGQATPVSEFDPSCLVVQVVPPSVVITTDVPPTPIHEVGDEHDIAVSDPPVRTVCCFHVLPPSIEARTMADLNAVSPTAKHCVVDGQVMPVRLIADVA
jgi:hypothetical protein